MRLILLHLSLMLLVLTHLMLHWQMWKLQKQDQLSLLHLQVLQLQEHLALLVPTVPLFLVVRSLRKNTKSDLFTKNAALGNRAAFLFPVTFKIIRDTCLVTVKDFFVWVSGFAIDNNIFYMLLILARIMAFV